MGEGEISSPPLDTPTQVCENRDMETTTPRPAHTYRHWDRTDPDSVACTRCGHEPGMRPQRCEP